MKNTQTSENVNVVKFAPRTTVKVKSLSKGTESGWDFHIEDFRKYGETWFVNAKMIVKGVSRSAIGVSAESLEAAENEALRKCRALFAPLKTTRSAYPEMPLIARTIGEMIGARQLEIIRVLETRTGIDANKFTMKRFTCNVDELSRRGGEMLIEQLSRTAAKQQKYRLAS